MNLAQLVHDYGYLAVFAGSLLEGETILVLAGFAAHQGYLSLPAVTAVAFVGGTLGDQLFFWTGRLFGPALVQRFPRLAPRVGEVRALMRRYDAGLIIGIRFMYGLRIAGPVVMGMCHLPPWRFALFNMIGAAIWAPLVAGAGYLFGQALHALLGDLQRIELLVLAAIVLVALAFGVLRRVLARRERAQRRQTPRD
jgi:membrane protein DedA with SNARE-associated domain